MVFKRGKRAISPLIATVLLIAFAVSIGTLIMNVAPRVIPNEGDCGKVNIQVYQINSKPMLCHDATNKKINMMLKNLGEVDIEYVKLAVTKADFSIDEYTLPNSSIKVGQTISSSLDYSKPGNFQVEINPVIIFSGQEKICSDNSLIAETIGQCN
ncbi:TPA: hypothetical protein HA235_03695 [Candidatus Woesearchaeota archaeon]|nr:hypothetical protein [Candidatus Woesearchaeota archaeon]HIH31785.1 hypothetical protein [Candidatus Woesearchaeota archaeon]HIJ01858.1 hypothetical protein [Candidatus Woesearchaeota archaeon]HIJ13815.1 hypothetical protein [Candidatus Woesearchaeota archaeon]